MTSNEPTRTQGPALKQAPKPVKCLTLLAMAAALVLVGLAIGLVIR